MLLVIFHMFNEKLKFTLHHCLTIFVSQNTLFNWFVLCLACCYHNPWVCRPAVWPYSARFFSFSTSCPHRTWSSPSACRWWSISPVGTFGKTVSWPTWCCNSPWTGTWNPEINANLISLLEILIMTPYFVFQSISSEERFARLAGDGVEVVAEGFVTAHSADFVAPSTCRTGLIVVLGRRRLRGHLSAHTSGVGNIIFASRVEGQGSRSF